LQQIHPIDLTKTRMQLIGIGAKGVARPSAFSVAAGVIKNEGVMKLYAG
jgi:hypothetical protein